MFDEMKFPEPVATPDTAAAQTPSPAPEQSPATSKFQSCRWKSSDGDFCTHRDVLPFAGKEGFKPDSWCGDCSFYKVRRAPRKREHNDYSPY